MKTLKDRFGDKVDYNGDCFEWTASRNSKGYGVQWVGSKLKKATHVAWFLEYGHWPDYKNKELIMHWCDNPCCVRISHLSLGDMRKNAMDAIGKGRSNPHVFMKGRNHNPKGKNQWSKK